MDVSDLQVALNDEVPKSPRSVMREEKRVLQASAAEARAKRKRKAESQSEVNRQMQDIVGIYFKDSDPERTAKIEIRRRHKDDAEIDNYDIVIVSSHYFPGKEIVGSVQGKRVSWQDGTKQQTAEMTDDGLQLKDGSRWVKARAGAKGFTFSKKKDRLDVEGLLQVTKKQATKKTKQVTKTKTTKTKKQQKAQEPATGSEKKASSVDRKIRKPKAKAQPKARQKKVTGREEYDDTKIGMTKAKTQARATKMKTNKK